MLFQYVFPIEMGIRKKNFYFIEEINFMFFNLLIFHLLFYENIILLLSHPILSLYSFHTKRLYYIIYKRRKEIILAVVEFFLCMNVTIISLLIPYNFSIIIFLYLLFQTPEDCSSGTDCLPMIISWEGSSDIQSGDVLIVEIDDKLLISTDKRNKSNDGM